MVGGGCGPVGGVVLSVVAGHRLEPFDGAVLVVLVEGLGVESRVNALL